MGKTISFMDPNVQLCPFAAYAKVREMGPVFQDAATGWYFVTDYELVRSLTADTDNLSSFTGVLMCKTKSDHQDEVDKIWAEQGQMPTPVLVVSDPPDHSFYRSFVDKSFTPARVKRMEEYLEGIVDDIVTGLIHRQEIEFRSEIATKLSLSVIADQLGMPRSDSGKLLAWSEAVMAHQDQSIGHDKALQLTRTICELHRYAAAKVEEYRKQPRECLLSDFANAVVDGRQLSMREVAAMVEQALTGGNDTSSSAMCSGMLRLIEAPELQSRLRADSELIPKFIEEVLRLDSPVQGLFREPKRDIDVGGVRIPKGSVVVLKWAAANRDPKLFANPDALDLDRPNSRRHLAFGYGAHSCVGNQLARGEMRIAFSKVLKKMGNIRLSRGYVGVVREPHFFSYGPKALYISFDAIA
jgi:cytochrome P450